MDIQALYNQIVDATNEETANMIFKILVEHGVLPGREDATDEPR